MARIRKAAKILRRAESRAAAAAVMFDPDDVFAIDLRSMFENRAPVEIEIGAGKGDFIAARAAENPSRNFLAVELSGIVSRMLAVRCGKARLRNLRVVGMDARALVNLMLEDQSVSAYHIYFPDPWPKERHHKHRLFTEFFVTNLERTLVKGGAVYVATDVRDYAGEIFRLLDGSGLARASEEAPGCEETAFGRRFAAAGKPVFSRAYRKN